MQNKLNLLQQYINSWLWRDKTLFLSTLGADVYIAECYGASYAGIEEAARWFEIWNGEGRVLSWEIAKVYYDARRKTLFATWEFLCQHPKVAKPCFNGITLLKTANGKISRLFEYAQEHDLYRPYQH